MLFGFAAKYWSTGRFLQMRQYRTEREEAAKVKNINDRARDLKEAYNQDLLVGTQSAIITMFLWLPITTEAPDCFLLLLRSSWQVS